MVPRLREARRGRGAVPGAAHEPEVLPDRHLGRHHLERDGEADRVPGPLHVEAVGVGLDAPHLEAAGGNAHPSQIGRNLPPGPGGRPGGGQEHHDRGDPGEPEPSAVDPHVRQLRTAMPITSNRAPRSRVPEPRNARAGGSAVK